VCAVVAVYTTGLLDGGGGGDDEDDGGCTEGRKGMDKSVTGRPNAWAWFNNGWFGYVFSQNRIVSSRRRLGR
jgi:hypothetical protein